MFIDFPLDCTKNSLENVTEIIKSNKEEIEKLGFEITNYKDVQAPVEV